MPELLHARRGREPRTPGPTRRPWRAARSASTRGREAVGRLVDQVAREVLRFGDDARRVRARLSSVRAAVRGHHGEALHRLAVFLVGLVAVRLVVAEDGAFDRRRHGLARRTGSRQKRDRAGRPSPFRNRSAAPAALRNSAASKRSRFPAADHQQAPGASRPARAVQQRHFERLAGDLRRTSTSPASGLRRTASVFFALEGQRHQGICFDVLDRPAFQD